MTRRYPDSFRGIHGGTNRPDGYPFCSAPYGKRDGDVWYCAGCGWAYAIHCHVPGCEHMRGNRKGSNIERGMEWLCTEHWRLVPGDLRRLYAAVNRARDAAIAEFVSLELAGQDYARRHPGRVHADIVVSFRAASERRENKTRQSNRIWSRITRAATERAVGIR